MFEKEIDRLISLMIDRTIGNSDSTSVKEILAAEIPRPIQTLIRVDIEHKLEEELKNKFINSRFDFSHPEVIGLQNQINSILVLNYKFNRSEYLELIEDAIHLMINYLIRPQWTLLNYIYENTTQVSGDYIVKSLRMFSAYDYLKVLITKVIQEKNIKLMTSNEFQNLVWKCDREFIRRKDGYQIANITFAIYEFINYGLKDIKAPVNLKGIIKFFYDKGLKVITNRLEAELQRNVSEISLDDLSLILEDLRQTHGVFEAEFQHQIKTQVQENLQQVVDKPKEDKSEINLEPIENFIDEEDRKKIIKKIFKKNEQDYLDAISEINKMTSWKDASKYIDEIYILNEVDLYSPEAIIFTDIAYKRFYPDNKK